MLLEMLVKLAYFFFWPVAPHRTKYVYVLSLVFLKWHFNQFHVWHESTLVCLGPWTL